MQLKSTQGIAASNGVKILVYGKAGRGKTTLCATAPAPVILSTESGLLSLARFNLPYIEINTIDDLRNAYKWCLSSAESKQFQTVCLDSISDIAEVCLAAAKGIGSGKKMDGRAAYGEMNDTMSDIIRKFRDLPNRHVYFSAKQEYVKNEQTGSLMNMPSMPGRTLTNNLPYYFDEVFQIDIEGQGEGSYRYLRTQPDFVNDAKDRSGMLAPVERPDLGYVIGKISGSI